MRRKMGFKTVGKKVALRVLASCAYSKQVLKDGQTLFDCFCVGLFVSATETEGSTWKEEGWEGGLQ